MYEPQGRRPGHWIGIGILALVAIFVVGMLAFMFYVASQGTPVAYMPFFPFGFGWFGFFLVFFLFFGLFRLVFWPWRWGYYRRYGYGYGYGREHEAYHILRERYARGEITKDQYDAMMRDLYQQQAPPRP